MVIFLGMLTVRVDYPIDTDHPRDGDHNMNGDCPRYGVQPRDCDRPEADENHLRMLTLLRTVTVDCPRNGNHPRDGPAYGWLKGE